MVSVANSYVVSHGYLSCPQVSCRVFLQCLSLRSSAGTILLSSYALAPLFATSVSEAASPDDTVSPGLAAQGIVDFTSESRSDYGQTFHLLVSSFL